MTLAENFPPVLGFRCLAGHMAMHACQIGPTDTAPTCPGSPLRACVGTKGGTLWGRQPFCPNFSSATQMCGRCNYTLPSFWDRSGSRDLRPRWCGCRMSPKWTSLDRLLLPLLGCWWQKLGGWRGPALGAGWRRLWAAPAAPVLSPSWATKVATDKSGHHLFWRRKMWAGYQKQFSPVMSISENFPYRYFSKFGNRQNRCMNNPTGALTSTLLLYH